MKTVHAEAKVAREANVVGFYLVWLGQAVSKSAGPFQLIAISLWALDTGRGAIGVSIVTSSGLFGTLCGTLLGGVIADRWGALKTIAVCDGARFVISGTIAVAMLAKDQNSFAVVTAGSFTASVLTGAFNPALRSLTPELLPQSKYEKGNSVFTAVSSASQLIGALLGGITVALLGPFVAVSINSASFLFGFLTSVLVVCLAHPAALAREPASSMSLFKAMKIGLNYARHTPWLLLMLCVDSVTDLVTAGQLFVGLPLVAKANGGGVAMGLLLAGYGGGALVGSLLSTRLRSSRVRTIRGILTLNVIQAPFLSAIPFLPLPCAVAALAVGGVLNALAMTYYISLVQRAVPAHLQSRVMSLLMSGGLILQPLGTLLLGTIANAGYLSASFLCGGVLMAGVALICMRTKTAGTLNVRTH